MVKQLLPAMRPHRIFQLTMICFILLHVLIIWWATLLPFTDLPNHLAEATIYKYDSTATLIGQYYKAVPAFFPNTFHAVFCSFFPSVEWGNKCFYTFYIILLPVSVYLVIRQLNGNVWFGLCSFLFIYNYNTTWGFTGFTLALPITFLLFWVALSDIKSPKVGYVFLASILLVLIYLMHAQMVLFALLLYCCMMLYAFWKRWKLFFSRILLVVFPVAVIISIWWSYRIMDHAEESTFSFIIHYYRSVYFQQLYRRLMLFGYDQMALVSGGKGIILGALITLLLFLPLIYFKVLRKISFQALTSKPYVHPFFLFALSLGCFMILPNELPGQSPLYQRFCTVVFLSFIILASVLLKNVHSRALSIYTVCICMLYSLAWAEYFYAFNKDNEAFRPSIFNQAPPQKIVSGLMFDNKFRGREVYLHFPAYNIVWHHGLTAFKAIDYRFGIVRRRNKGSEIPVYQEWIGKNSKTIASYQDSVQYLLVKEKQPIQPDSNLLNFTPILQAAQWSLYSNGKFEQ